MTRTIISILAAAVLLSSAAGPAVSQGIEQEVFVFNSLGQTAKNRAGWGTGNYNAQYSSPDAVANSADPMGKRQRTRGRNLSVPPFIAPMGPAW